jgi:hypothetical protein
MKPIITQLELNFHEAPVFIKSQIANAVQVDWEIPCEFPLCPQTLRDVSVNTYASNLNTGEVFSRNRLLTTIVHHFAIADDGNTLWVLVRNAKACEIKPWLLAQITFKDQHFVHTNLGSYFKEDGAEKAFMLAQGQE